MAASPDVPTLSLTETIEVIEVEQPPTKRLKLSSTAATAAASVEDATDAAAAFDQRLLQYLSDGRTEAVAGLLLGGGADTAVPPSPAAVTTPSGRVRALHHLARAAGQCLGGRLWLERTAALLRHLTAAAAAAAADDLAQDLLLLMTASVLTTPMVVDDIESASAEDFQRSLLNLLLAPPSSPPPVGLTLCGLDCLRRLLSRSAAAAGAAATGADVADKTRELLASAVSHADPRLVAHGLRLMGRALEPRDRVLPPRVTGAELAAFMAVHEDPRVRRAAHACHLEWLRRRATSSLATSPVPLELAHSAMDADDDPEVRAICIDIALAGALAGGGRDGVDQQQQLPAAADDDAAVNAGDAGFRRLAGAMQDASPAVRVRAARALGRLAGRVSEAELAATLDRQVMTDLRLRPRAARPGAPQQPYPQNGGGRRPQPTAGAPIGDLELKEMTLLNLGSSGAFVNGFEDESSAVRAAAVLSAGRLAERCPAFAELCADILVDMLADDIHAVRMAAVRALARLPDFRLARPQLHVCLGALKEDNAELRRGLRDLLARCGLADTDCLWALVTGLLDNITRYPADLHCVWRCSAAVGRRHCGLMQLMMTDLLCLHPYLQGAEPRKEDPALTAVMLAVLNATAGLPQLRALLPAFAARHYAYLRESLPGLTPLLPRLLTAAQSPPPLLSAAASLGGGAPSAVAFFDATLARVRAELGSGGGGEGRGFRRLLRPLLGDLARLGRLHPALAGRAAFARDWCRLAVALSSSATPSEASPSGSGGSTTSASSASIGLTYRLQLLYSGQGQAAIDQLLRVRASLLVGSGPRPLPPPPPPPLPDPLPAGLARLSALLLEPSTDGIEETRRFPAGLPLPVAVRARIRGCPRTDAIRVCLRLPDRRRVVWAPAADHWTSSSPSSAAAARPGEVQELSTRLLVTCPQWNSSAQLQVCLAVQMDDWEAEVTPCVPVVVQPQPVSKC